MKTWQIIVGVLLIPTAIVGVNLINKPAQLLDKATNTTKMLQNYEWFYEAAHNYKARVSQIDSYKVVLMDETDKDERARLRVDLTGMQQSCRELVAKYEAQSGKVHVGYLKSNKLPESLDAKECE